MAFKMKGPSLLKMVKQMRENSPMKKDSAASKVGAKAKKKVKKPSDFLIDKYGEDSVRKAFGYGPDEKIGYSPAKQDLGSLQTNRNKEEASKSLGKTIVENKNIKKTSLGDTVDAMQKQENTQTGDLTYTGGSFDQAFADAKKSGAGVFTHNDKKYRTQTKKEKEMDDALSKIPKKKIQPLPVKTDAELKSKK